MGNCFTNHRNNKCLTEIAPADQFTTLKPMIPVVYLHGDPTNIFTYYLRFLLRYKSLSLHFIPRPETPEFTIRFDTEYPVSGPFQTILGYVESKLPFPALLKREKVECVWGEDKSKTPVVVMVRMAALQHRSMRLHLERVDKWGMDLATRGGLGVIDSTLGTLKMEVGKLGKSYGKLLEILLEHAQMEERILFPLLQASDPGVCRCVTEEHARDLPIMNGIKEDIKSVGVLKPATSTYQEALYSLSARLKALQENCTQHFDEEEKYLFPLMEAADLDEQQQRKYLEQCIKVMQGTHSHLIRFFIEGLHPHEAMEYVDLVMNCTDQETMASILCMLVE
ncbi:unnamed protein product [Amaranthus hypochondriacus]